MMNKIKHLIFFTAFLFWGCSEEEQTIVDNGVPIVKSSSSYTVLTQENITYAEGKSYDASLNLPEDMPLLLDVYYPENSSTNRPLYIFIHGGGFQGGTKTKPEIVAMANYFVSRGWVFASIDYRTVEDLGTITGMTPEGVTEFYKGIAPRQWIEYSLQNALTPENVQTSVAMYAAQRDAKSAVRWMVANASTYNINSDYITIGGASAGAITTVALGISDQEDFRDEISSAEDPTLSTTNSNVSYTVKSMVYFWGSNAKLSLFEAVYGVNPYDANDPELFMAHGTDDITPGTLFSEAEELKGIYDSLGIYNQLIPLEGQGHGAWNATVNGKSLSELSFDFLVDRQNLRVE